MSKNIRRGLVAFAVGVALALTVLGVDVAAVAFGQAVGR